MPLSRKINSASVATPSGAKSQGSLESRVKKATSKATSKGKKAAAPAPAAPAAPADPAALAPGVQQMLLQMQAQMEAMQSQLEQTQAEKAELEKAQASSAAAPAGFEWTQQATVSIELYEAKKSGATYPAVKVWLAGSNPFRQDGVTESSPSFFFKASDFIRLYEDVIIPDGEEIYEEAVEVFGTWKAAQDSSKASK